MILIEYSAQSKQLNIQFENLVHVTQHIAVMSSYEDWSWDYWSQPDETNYVCMIWEITFEFWWILITWA